LEWNSVDSMELYLAECLELKTVEKKEPQSVAQLVSETVWKSEDYSEYRTGKQWAVPSVVEKEQNLVELLENSKAVLSDSRLVDKMESKSDKQKETRKVEQSAGHWVVLLAVQLVFLLVAPTVFH
jgi:hypothetical protein